jgi:ATP-dependent Clp protease ATP-binding subunit ClpA
MKTIKDYYEHLKRFVKCNLSYFFEFVLNRKEIYGRLYDSVVVYNYICKEAAEGIIKKQMKKVNNTAAQLGLNVDTEHVNYQKVFEYVCRFSNTNEVRGLGGRGIIKNVDKVYGTAISNKIIETQKNKFDNVTVTFEIVDDKIKVNFLENK